MYIVPPVRRRYPVALAGYGYPDWYGLGDVPGDVVGSAVDEAKQRVSSAALFGLAAFLGVGYLAWRAAR